MKIKHTRHQLTAIGLAISLILFTTATIEAAKADTVVVPKRDIAVIDVPHPKEGNLLMLRGLVGKGTASFRIDGQCRSMPVRFVAGDFSGRSIDFGKSKSIQIVVTAPDVIRDLLAGKDLVSDMVHVASDPADKAADLHLAKGLSADTGFVINPGRSLLADVLGARKTDVDCASLSTRLP
ncbi:hypothetical protein [uncultured Litoreibacter sp.]|uniref:hypothetical protein n=1 Tax=uncultured Litoreibacter sp. TaxID=1392394 RepID=UPI00260D03A7|nr:hypothetical protein [uncultured Litoreibacter sp.]